MVVVAAGHFAGTGAGRDVAVRCAAGAGKCADAGGAADHGGQSGRFGCADCCTCRKARRCLRIDRTAYLPSGRPIEFTRGLYRSDIYDFRCRIAAGGQTMTLTFDARIVGTEIHCEIGSDTALSGAVFCCSMFVPSRVVSGGTLLRSVAGYIEVALPDIPAGGMVPLVLAYVEAWLCAAQPGLAAVGWPICARRRGVIALPALETGVRVDRRRRRVSCHRLTGCGWFPSRREWVPAGGRSDGDRVCLRRRAVGRCGRPGRAAELCAVSG